MTDWLKEKVRLEDSAKARLARATPEQKARRAEVDRRAEQIQATKLRQPKSGTWGKA